MNRQQYIDRAKAEIEKARRRLPEYAGDCSECRWSCWASFDRVCGHPAIECAAFNITDAYARDRLQECDYQRDTDTIWGPVLCGPDGALFEQRQSWWARIFG